MQTCSVHVVRYRQRVPGFWLAGGLVILLWGVILVTDVHGLGSRFISLVGRFAPTRRQQRYIERGPRLYRIAFGVAGVVIGAGWVLASLESLVG
jgi:hypothetical protein